MTVAPACTCVISDNALSYPLSSCPSSPCCFTYTSTSGNTCFCGNYDAQTCSSYISAYNGSKKSACP
jgi:hypothetical protein